MSDLISRQKAIDALGEEPEVWTGKDEYAQGLNNQWHYDVNALKKVPSAQSEPSTVIQEILDYLDNTLHLIVSPDNWNVYSELHDMVSKLPAAQPERKKGHWIDTGSGQECSICHEIQYGYDNYRHFCSNCGAYMRGEDE